MEQQSPDQVVARLVREAIDRTHLSDRQVAILTDIPQTTLGRRLRGASSFKVAELAILSTVLGVPLASFLPELEDAA